MADASDEEVIAVLTFDPFRDLDRVTDQMLARGTTRTPRFMPMDLYRSGDHYVLLADLPGVDPGSVDVTVENGLLTLRAERTSPTESGVQWIANERFSGSFMRQITLGDHVDGERITATYTNGVLSVTIPVAERAKPRRVEVTAPEADSRTVEIGS